MWRGQIIGTNAKLLFLRQKLTPCLKDSCYDHYDIIAPCENNVKRWTISFLIVTNESTN